MPRAEAPAGPDLRHELDLARRGVEPVAGVDEAGRGALAGPIFAAAVILPLDRFDLARALDGVRDSKTLSARQRRHWADQIRTVALAWSIGDAACSEIDVVGPLEASRRAMQRALLGLALRPRHVLTDHLLLADLACDQTPLTHGDSVCLTVAAASVIAKVARDQVMEALGRDFPTYGFSIHKGYGTAGHLRALRRWGPSPAHRRSFAPVAALLD